MTTASSSCHARTPTKFSPPLALEKPSKWKNVNVWRTANSASTSTTCAKNSPSVVSPTERPATRELTDGDSLFRDTRWHVQGPVLPRRRLTERQPDARRRVARRHGFTLSLIHISEPTRQA